MTIYLCTVGTSAAKGMPKQWLEHYANDDDATLALLDSFSRYPLTEPHVGATLSAELHSLYRLGLTANDRVIFYCSDSREGRCCGQALGLYLQQQRKGVEVLVRTVKGLQVKDASVFRRSGVVEFVRLLHRDILDFGASFCVLNPTGGYKALVPYMVLMGIFYRVPMRYIFEQSTSLLTLPPLPLELGPSWLQVLTPIYEELQRDSEISAVELEKRVGKEALEYCQLLFDQEGQSCTLSAVGHMLFEQLAGRQYLAPYVAHRSYPELLKLQARQDCQTLTFLARIARDAGAYQTALHGNAGAGLEWLKPGNTTDRYLVSREQWRLLVWRAVDHPDYERLSRVPDLGPSLRNKRREYAPFVRLDFVD